jgi:5'-3' exonuclease
MGVRKLNKFLTTRDIIKSYRNIQEFIDEHKYTKNSNNSHNGKIVIAIDFWLYAHKFLHSCRSKNILLGFWYQIMNFLSYGIIPLYVMDGAVPIGKRVKVEERMKKRANYKIRINAIDIEIEKYINVNDFVNIDQTDILENMLDKKEKLQKHIKKIKTSELYNIYKLFDVLGVPYIKADFEADALCAKLFKENIITACLSDDMDMLALGCGSTIKFQDGLLVEFNLKQVMNELKFTQDQFIDMCIMFGCDYLHHPFRLECNEVYNMIKKHGSLLDALCSNEHVLFNMNNSNVKVIGEHYYQVRDTYLNSHKKEYIPDKLYDFKMKKIIFDDLVVFLKKLRCFDTIIKNINHIEYNVNKINYMIDSNEM